MIDDLPPELVKNVRALCGEQAEPWLAGLPELVHKFELQWAISVGAPFVDGEYNYVARANDSAGYPCVFKIAPPRDDRDHFGEVAYLTTRAGRGAVKVLAYDREHMAMVLERAIPGRSLADGFIGRQSEIVTSAIGVLSSIQMPVPIGEVDVIYLSDWFSNLERAEGSAFPQGYAEKALSFYDDLSARAPARYLHGDFHPGNIVTATREPFLVIDPKGIVGPLGYDIAVFLNNLYWGQKDEVETSLIRRNLDPAIGEFSTAFGISEIDLRKWAFATQVLGAWWMFDEMPDVYDHEVEKADIWDV